MSPLLVSVCLFTLHFAVVRCAPNIIFPEEEQDKLIECLADEFKIEFKGECRSLLKQDPNVCPKGQWLVLDLLSASLPTPEIKGKCAPQRCPSRQHYWVDGQRCVGANQSSSLCPVGNTIDTDFFGDGFCSCIKNPVHVRDEKTGKCYPAFKRGPCSKDKVWVVGGCRKDNCAETRARSPGQTIVPWSDGKCYAVDKPGPCKSGSDISINSDTITPECVDRLTHLHLVDGGGCTGTSYSGQCTRPVSSPQTTFYNRVSSQVNTKRN